MNNLQPTNFFNTSLAAFKSFEKAHPYLVRGIALVTSIAVPIFVFLCFKPPPPPIPVFNDEELAQPRADNGGSLPHYTMEELRNMLEGDGNPYEVFLSALENKIEDDNGVKDAEVKALLRAICLKNKKMAEDIARIYYTFIKEPCPSEPLTLYVLNKVNYSKLWQAAIAYSLINIDPDQCLDEMKTLCNDHLIGEREINRTRTIVWMLASELKEEVLDNIMQKMPGVPEKGSSDTSYAWFQRVFKRCKYADLLRLKEALDSLE